MPLQEDIVSLSALVQRMVEESGDPIGFDSQAWLQDWLVSPVPALGNRRPLDFLNEPGGVEVVRSILLRAQDCGYS